MLPTRVVTTGGLAAGGSAPVPELSMGTIVPLSTLSEDLAVSPNKMTAGGTVHLLIDVFGYFQ